MTGRHETGTIAAGPAPDGSGIGKGLDHEEPLLFEQDSPGACGVDLPPVPDTAGDRLNGLERQSAIGLPGLSEPEVVRHFTRLSRRNHAIDTGMYPLGSCTMKHNPRLNEKLARLPGLAGLHPLQPVSTVQGALALIDRLAHWLKTLTGMPAVAMTPAAGAHGELCGMMAIRSALDARGETARRRVLVPESAHGTNPATATMCGFSVDPVPADDRGRVAMDKLRVRLDAAQGGRGDDVAAIMLTNPNTCGLFEPDIVAIAAAIHDAGGYFYCDGANFNAIMGRVRPGDLGVDCMHINLHKTFSTPHGGGGPGAGPVVLSAALAPHAPLPWVVAGPDGFRLAEHGGDGHGTGDDAAVMDGMDGAAPLGRLRAFHGQMGMFVRALAYMLSHGRDGIRQASGDAVLGANYVMHALSDVMSVPYPGPCMHEVLFDERFLKDSGIGTLDFAKGMIDSGVHPMTVYFPLVVQGAMLVEPTESEPKRSLDALIALLRDLAARARAGDADYFRQSPRFAPRRRLDETRAARQPVLKWTPPAPDRPPGT